MSGGIWSTTPILRAEKNITYAQFPQVRGSYIVPRLSSTDKYLSSRVDGPESIYSSPRRAINLVHSAHFPDGVGQPLTDGDKKSMVTHPEVAGRGVASNNFGVSGRAML